MADASRRISLSRLGDEDRLVLDRLRGFGDVFCALCFVWIVGGWVRDVLSGLPDDSIDDIDIATTLTPEEVRAIFPRSIMVGEKFGTAIVRVLDTQ